VLQCDEGDRSTDHAGRAQAVAEVSLGGAARQGAAEHRVRPFVLGQVIGGGGGAVQVQIADVLRCQARAAQGGAHGVGGTAPTRLGCGHMVGVAALAVAQQGVRGLGTRVENCEARRLADRDA